MFQKIQDAVSLLNQEYIQSFCVSEKSRAQDLRKICKFRKQTCREQQVLKNDYEFQRFLLRGKTKVKLEILLLSMGYNLNKLHAKIQKGRAASHLFPIKETA